MKEKLVEEWLIRARERGGIDHAFGQFLISQGHEILWLGHSRTEFGKDILSVAPDGQFHAYQIKDEDIDLKELRNIRDQIIELVETPPVHPRIPHGSSHVPHLVTSGLFKEEATLQIRAMNEGWTARGQPQLEVIGRGDLIPRFVGMSDAFWPEEPADIRDFFSFYLAQGTGDFDPKKFSGVLRGLLPLSDEPARRKAQRLAAVGLLADYLLNSFEREGDHWSLFQGWTMVAAHQAWYASRAGIPERAWKPSFRLAKEAAIERLFALSAECLAPNAFLPSENEFDDYTRSRNLVLSAVLAVTGLLAPNQVTGDIERVKQRLEMLLRNERLYVWGESAVPHVIAVQWYAETQTMTVDTMPLLQAFISELCERNYSRSEEEFVPPQLVSADDALTELFRDEPSKELNRRCPGTWSLEAIVYLLARRQRRDLLSKAWPGISRLDTMSFQPEPAVDGLLWQCPTGREAERNPDMTQSWVKLVEKAWEDRSGALPQILREDRDFALMFFLAYPHRLSPGLVGLLDNLQRNEAVNL
jgi:hypothetical protein